MQLLGVIKKVLKLYKNMLILSKIQGENKKVVHWLWLLRLCGQELSKRHSANVTGPDKRIWRKISNTHLKFSF